MSLQQLFTSRKPYAASTFVAGKGKIFYDETSGYLRIGDGHTAGGHAIGLPQASTSTFGGVKLGPGVILNGDNQIIIDSSGLSFNFGDFQATTPGDGAATLSSINENQNVSIVSNGTGAINCIGNFHVHTTASYDPEVPDSDGAIFRVNTQGQVRMLVPTANSVTGAVEIIGSLSGEYQTPVQTGVMLHVTGQLSDANRLYFDGNNNYVVVTGRRYNGTAIAPTAVLNNDIIVRYGANAYNGTAWNSGGVARMEINATENHDVGGQGTNIKFYTTTKRATTQTARLILDEAGATIQSGGSFIGPLTGNVTGTATTATYAQSFNTGTLVTNAVTAQTAGTVTTAAQPTITSVGTLTSLSVTNLVTANNYAGQARNAGTLGAGGTLVIDFATDHNVLVNLTTTAAIGFVNTSSGKTVTVMVKNATGNNRAVTLGVVAGNTSGGNNQPNVNDGRTGVLVYRTFGTATTDVYCEFN